MLEAPGCTLKRLLERFSRMTKPTYPRVVELLIDLGAPLKVTGSICGSALVEACSSRDNFDIIKILISRGADVNYMEKHMNSPLINLCRMGRHDEVDLLLEQGALVRPESFRFEMHALVVACCHWYPKITKILCHRKRCGVEDQYDLGNRYKNSARSPAPNESAEAWGLERQRNPIILWLALGACLRRPIDEALHQNLGFLLTGLGFSLNEFAETDLTIPYIQYMKPFEDSKRIFVRVAYSGSPEFEEQVRRALMSWEALNKRVSRKLCAKLDVASTDPRDIQKGWEMIEDYLRSM